MTVTVESNISDGTGDGSNKIFPFNFELLQSGDLDVYKDEVLQGSGYTVQINANGVGGTVTFASAPANGVEILMVRNVDITQETALPVEGNLPEATLETMVDKLTMICQQLAEKLSRAFTVPFSLAPFTPPEPEPLLFIRWNATGDALENSAVEGIEGGTVTSFSATPSGIFDVTNPTSTPELSLDNQAANIVLAGPSSGAAATPAFRALVADDIPNHSTDKLTTGTIPIARGGTNNATLGVSALGIVHGDGTKLAQTVGTALQTWRVNAGGTAIEAYTPGEGTVTSFSAAPSGIFDVANPTTTPELSLDNQNANIVLAGPGSGAAATPGFRSLVSDDIPNLDVSKLTAGTLPIARGGTNNGSLGVSALGIYNGDGSKVVQTTAAAGQSWRVNAGGTAVEAFTPATGLPGGASTQIQFNDGGSAFGGDSGLTWEKTNNFLTINTGSDLPALKIFDTGASVTNPRFEFMTDGDLFLRNDTDGSPEGVILRPEADTLRVIQHDGNDYSYVECNGTKVKTSDSVVAAQYLGTSIEFGDPAGIQSGKTSILLDTAYTTNINYFLPNFQGGSDNTFLVTPDAVAAGGVYYGTANLGEAKISGAGLSGFPLLSGGSGAPSFNTLGLGGGGTNNASLAATNWAFMVGDGSKIVETAAVGASQSIRRNAAGTAFEAFTPSSASVITKIKASDQAITNDATVNDDNDLSFPIAASESWAFTIFLYVESGTTPDFKYAFTVPAGAVITHGYNASQDEVATITVGTGEVQVACGASPSVDFILIKGTVINSTNAGTVQFRWSQATSNGTSTTVKKGSSLEATKAA